MTTHPGREKHFIRAYGDRRDDGIIQLSFTLPVTASEKAKEAAKLFCQKLGLTDVKVAAIERAAEHYTFFVVYAKANVVLDYAEIDTPEIIIKKKSFDELNAFIEVEIARRLVVFGACTGTDTHTVGIDAILVSQVVTQRDVHKDNSRAFIDEAKKQGVHGKMTLLLGGPRVDHKLAIELGFDAGFGPGTKPSDVANFVVHQVLQRMGKEQKGTHFEGAPT